jgi:hypothetical protein
LGTDVRFGEGGGTLPEGCRSMRLSVAKINATKVIMVASRLYPWNTGLPAIRFTPVGASLLSGCDMGEPAVVLIGGGSPVTEIGQG